MARWQYTSQTADVRADATKIGQKVHDGPKDVLLLVESRFIKP